MNQGRTESLWHLNDHDTVIFFQLLKFNSFATIVVVVQLLSHTQLFVTHRLQHNSLPCPVPSPRVCLNSCSLTQRCHPTSHSLLPPSPPALNLSQHQGLMSWLLAPGGQSIETILATTLYLQLY